MLANAADDYNVWHTAKTATIKQGSQIYGRPNVLFNYEQKTSTRFVHLEHNACHWSGPGVCLYIYIYIYILGWISGLQICFCLAQNHVLPCRSSASFASVATSCKEKSLGWSFRYTTRLSRYKNILCISTGNDANRRNWWLHKHFIFDNFEPAASWNKNAKTYIPVLAHSKRKPRTTHIRYQYIYKYIHIYCLKTQKSWTMHFKRYSIYIHSSGPLSVLNAWHVAPEVWKRTL